MTYFPWSQDYSVGVRLIDNDHKQLVELVNDLHEQIAAGASHERVTTALAFLARYVKDHFAREEALMAEYGYPELAAHRLCHQNMAAKIHALQRVQRADPERLDPRKLLLFLREWLIHHILGADRKYVPYLHGEAAGLAVTEDPNPAPEAAKPPKAPLSVELEVSPEKVEVLRRCAQILAGGGEAADQLEALAQPSAAMTLDEAEQLIAPLLR